MKKLIAVIITSITLCATASQAHSTDRVIAGTLIGAGSGALIGQAIGHNTESTVLGTAIGGLVGFTAGSLHHPGHVSSSVHIGYNSSYPVRTHRPYHGYHNYRPKHQSYYHPRQTIIIKKVYKNVNHYKVKKRFVKDHRYNGRHYSGGKYHQSRRHDNNHRVRQYHRR